MDHQRWPFALQMVRPITHALVTAKTGSITKTAETLSLSPSVISQSVRRVETEFGVTLFHRNGRAMVLTPEGKRVLRALEKPVGRLFDQIDTLRFSEIEPKVLRLTAPLGFRDWLEDRLPRLNDILPGCRFDISLSDELADMSEGRFDVAIRIGDSPVAPEPYRLNRVSPVLVAAQSLLAGQSHRGSMKLPYVAKTGLVLADNLRTPEGRVLLLEETRQTNDGPSIRRAVRKGEACGLFPSGEDLDVTLKIVCDEPFEHSKWTYVEFRNQLSKRICDAVMNVLASSR